MPPARLPPLPTLLVISMPLQHVPPQSEEEERTSLSFPLIRHVGGWFVFSSSYQIVCVLSLWHVAQHWEQCIFSIIRKVSERRALFAASISPVFCFVPVKCVSLVSPASDRSRVCQNKESQLLQMGPRCLAAWVIFLQEPGKAADANKRGCVSLTRFSISVFSEPEACFLTCLCPFPEPGQTLLSDPLST